MMHDLGVVVHSARAPMEAPKRRNDYGAGRGSAGGMHVHTECPLISRYFELATWKLVHPLSFMSVSQW